MANNNDSMMGDLGGDNSNLTDFTNFRMSQSLDLNSFVNAFENGSVNTFQAFQQHIQQPNISVNTSNIFNQNINRIDNNNNNNNNNIYMNSNTQQTTSYQQFQQQQQQQTQIYQTNMQIPQQQQQFQHQQQQQQLNSGYSNIFGGTDIQAELKELFLSLQSLSTESAQHLFFICRALHPHSTEELRFQLLSKMFSDIPKIIDQLTFSNYINYAQDPSNHALKLFLEFKELSNMFGHVSYSQLFQLTNNLIPPGSPQYQFSILQRIQEYFQHVNYNTLKQINGESTSSDLNNNTPVYISNHRLLQIDPNIPIEIIHFIGGMMSLPMTELLSFHTWFTVLSKKMLAVLLAILQLESATVLELKRILATSYPPVLIQPFDMEHQQQQQQKQYNIASPSNSNTFNNNNNNTPGQQNIMPDYQLFSLNLSSSLSSVPSENQQYQMSPQLQSQNSIMTNLSSSSIPKSPSINTSTQQQLNVKNESSLLLNTSESSILASSSSTDDCPFYLKIARQPPAITVYQRILKPFPSVMLCGPGVETANLSNFFVEASLLRNDNHSELPTCLDGNKISRISNGVFAPFKKLKILSTTQQQRTLFRIRFVLKRYIGSDFQTISKASVLSDPIEVFSHTIYLTDKQDVPLPPTVTEVIPAQGPPNTRMVVLGTNFLKGESLCVSFGPLQTTAQYYEKGTIICNAPERGSGVKTGTSVPVKVSNDGEQFSTDNISFTYTR